MLRPDGREIVWKDDLDSTLTLPENISELERLHSGINWRAPEKRVRPDKPVQWKDEDFRAGPNGDSYEKRVGVIVKRHNTKAKGKIYTAGRIQLTVDERFIGQEAEVRIFIQGAGGENKASKTMKPTEPRFGKRSNKDQYFNP